MTHYDRIKTAIWTPAAIVVALVAMHWLATDVVPWEFGICLIVAAVCGVADYVFERRRKDEI